VDSASILQKQTPRQTDGILTADQERGSPALRSLSRYIGVGLLIGFVAGLVEALIVNRTGVFFVPYAALAYGILTSSGLVILAGISRLIRRDLLAVGVAIATAGFFMLEAAFWLNKASPLPAGSLQSTVVNIIVVVGGLGLGILVTARLRRCIISAGGMKGMLWILGALVAIMGVYFTRVYVQSDPGTNCILISIDALRPDHLGCYGYHRKTSPNIDRLAAEGARWVRAFTTCPGSTAGHASMLTGLYPLTHGAYVNAVRLPDEVETAAEVFKHNGYSTAAFTRNWYISPAIGFGQGFDCFVDRGYGLILGTATPRILMRGLALWQTALRVIEKPGQPTTMDVDDALDWIRARHRHRFFLFLHLMDTHSPYIPPADLAGRFGEGDLSPARIQHLHNESLRRSLTEEEIRFLVDRYDEEILSADRKVGMLLDELERLAIDGSTMIILLADHGEVMAEGEHRQFGHGTLDYGSLRIPLIMRLPGKISGALTPAGTVQCTDVLPTITGLLGLKDTAPRQGVFLFSEGMDSLTAERPAFATGDILARDEYTIITPAWQYTVLGERVTLHNLESDPYHAPDVLGDAESSDHEAGLAVADSLRHLLDEWTERSLAEAVVPFSAEGRSVTPGDETRKRLKALGYIQ
jgi:arylsulfatase